MRDVQDQNAIINTINEKQLEKEYQQEKQQNNLFFYLCLCISFSESFSMT